MRAEAAGSSFRFKVQNLMPGAVYTSSRSFRLARPWSLRSILILLVGTAFVPLLVFAIAMVFLSARSEREVFERGATERTRALVTAIDAELKSSITTLEALATSDQLDRVDLRGFYDEAARVLKSQPGWRNVIVSLPSGESLLNLLRPLDSKLEPVVEQRSFSQVLKTLKPAVGDVLLGPLIGEYGFIIRAPVMRDGGMKYVLSAVISARSIDALISPQRLPENWIGVVLDFNKRFVTRTIEPERNIGQLASESLRAAVDRSSEGWFRGTTVEGWDVYTPYSRSSFSGWSVALGIPADFVDATLRRSLLYLVFFGIGLLALSLLIAWILSARTAESIASLSLIAQEVTSGKSSLAAAAASAHDSTSRIAEVEAVREAFVTAHRLLGEQSEEKERIALRLQLALASGNIGVHEWHPQTNEIIWDDRVRAHWGLSAGTPIDHHIFRQGLHPDDRVKLKAALKRALDPTSDGQYHAEFRVIGIEDHVERWIEARGQVVFENRKPIRLSGTTIDISERKAFQAELERQVQERTVTLEETIGELEAFSYSVSHDMRAPLRAMEGYAKALLTDYNDRLDSEARHWLDRIFRSAQRLDFLIKDVLAYSRVAKEEIELFPVDLERLIEDILATNPEFQSPRARITVKKPLDRVLGHEAYLTQCVTNLLSNAIKFVSEDVIPEICIRSERRDGKVRLWFEDNGIGIDPAHHARIFQIFGQIYPQEKYGGTGIGLAIVRKAVQRMNGEVSVESETNKGSRFYIILNG
jgi:signal transduction histidine kinase